MINFKEDFKDDTLVRMFEPGSGKWIKLCLDEDEKPTAQYYSSKDQSTVLVKGVVTEVLLMHHGIKYDIDVYDADTLGTGLSKSFPESDSEISDAFGLTESF